MTKSICLELLFIIYLIKQKDIFKFFFISFLSPILNF